MNDIYTPITYPPCTLAPGCAVVMFSDIAPAAPSDNILWFDTIGLQMYCWYDDGTSAQWVPVINQGSAGVPDAPTDGQIYGRNGLTTSWSPVLSASGGTMQGPLNVMATGGTTSRSVQDQFGDLADVKDFGAKGDGATNDTAAFMAAAATGKTVLVTPGTYVIQPIIIAQSLVGLGVGTTILRAAPGGNPVNDTLITQNAAAGALIRDLTIDGANVCLFGVYCPSGNAQQTGLRFERLEVKNFGSSASTASPLPSGIFVQLDETRPTSKQAIVVADCYVHNIYGTGIGVGGIGCIVSRNTVINVGSAGISCDMMQDGIISDNTINSPGQVAAMSADGVTGYAHTNLRVLISNNTVDNSGNNGIHFGGNNIQIIGNKVYNVVANSILLACEANPSNPGYPYAGANALVANNEIDTAALNGIYANTFSRVMLVGNTVANATQSGIAVGSSPDCIVADNIIWTAGTGIYANTSPNLQVHNNRINGTTNQGIADAGGNSTGMRVSDNIITSEGVTSNWNRVLAPLGSGVVDVTGALTVDGGTLTLDNATSNFEIFGAAGIAPPAFTTRSVGTRIVLYPNESSTSVDNAIGVYANGVWSSVGSNSASNVFAWYGGTTQVATLDGTGNLSLSGNVYAPAGVIVYASGAYPFQLIQNSSPSAHQLQFQGPSYAISCDNATGDISFLVGSAIATCTGQAFTVNANEFVTQNWSCDASVQTYAVTASGFSATIPNYCSTYILTGTTTRAAGTIVLAAASPANVIIRIASQCTITALTITPTAGTTLANPPTTIAAGGAIGLILVGTVWYRLQ